MPTWMAISAIYLGTGACFSALKWSEDRIRAERSRSLRKALDMQVKEHPIWVEVLGLSIIRALVWPLHLIIHDL